MTAGDVVRTSADMPGYGSDMRGVPALVRQMMGSEVYVRVRGQAHYLLKDWLTPTEAATPLPPAARVSGPDLDGFVEESDGAWTRVRRAHTTDNHWVPTADLAVTAPPPAGRFRVRQTPRWARNSVTAPLVGRVVAAIGAYARMDVGGDSHYVPPELLEPATPEAGDAVVVNGERRRVVSAEGGLTLDDGSPIPADAELLGPWLPVMAGDRVRVGQTADRWLEGRVGTARRVSDDCPVVELGGRTHYINAAELTTVPGDTPDPSDRFEWARLPDGRLKFVDRWGPVWCHIDRQWVETAKLAAATRPPDPPYVTPPVRFRRVRLLDGSRVYAEWDPRWGDTAVVRDGGMYWSAVAAPTGFWNWPSHLLEDCGEATAPCGPHDVVRVAKHANGPPPGEYRVTAADPATITLSGGHQVPADTVTLVRPAPPWPTLAGRVADPAVRDRLGELATALGWEPEHLRDDLAELDEVLPGATLKTTLRRELVVVATTGPVTLAMDDGSCETELGRFRLTLTVADEYNLKAEALEPNPCGSYVHPHVASDGHICLGDDVTGYQNAVPDAVKAGLPGWALRMAAEVLANYNDASPYVPLEEWDDDKCDNCGSRGESRGCAGCDTAGCDDCTGRCECGSRVHEDCGCTCEGCDASCCADCSEVVGGDRLCNGCHDTCPACGTRVRSGDLAGDRCADCAESDRAGPGDLVRLPAEPCGNFHDHMRPCLGKVGRVVQVSGTSLYVRCAGDTYFWPADRCERLGRLPEVGQQVRFPDAVPTDEPTRQAHRYLLGQTGRVVEVRPDELTAIVVADGRARRVPWPAHVLTPLEEPACV